MSRPQTLQIQLFPPTWRRTAHWALATATIGGGVMMLAGQWDSPWLWAYTALWSVGLFVALLLVSPDLAQERFKPPDRGADRVALRVIRVVGVAHLVIGAVDARFGWSPPVAPHVRILGLAGFGVSFALVVSAMAANRFFSAVVRVQTDRGHRVVDRGPYAYVRHPGYAGMIAAMPCSALSLGSWWACAIALIYSALIFRRVRFEDRYLRANLPGYLEYTRRVRAKLLPGIW